MTLCFVCGFNFDGFDDVLPWGPDGVDPTVNYCPCCGVEFGFGDATLESARAWRGAWRDREMVWSEPEHRPADWDAARQLAGLPERAKDRA